MSADHWNSGVRTFGHAEEDEEEWVSYRKEPWPESSQAAALEPPPSTSADSVPGLPPRSLVVVTLGVDRLPEDIRLDSTWQRVVASDNYGESVLKACELELFTSTLRLIEAGVDHVGGMLPSRRQRLLALMRTSSFAQFKEVENTLRSIGEFVGNGPAKSQWGDPFVSVQADRGGVTNVTIDPEWAEKAQVYEIQGELIDCIAEIRRQLIAFTPSGNDSYLSDEELELSVEAHFKRLHEAEL